MQYNKHNEGHLINYDVKREAKPCRLHHNNIGAVLLLPGSHNIHTLFHGLFQQSFHYHYSKQCVDLSYDSPETGSAILHYNTDAQLFFLSQYVIHREHSNHSSDGSQGMTHMQD